MTREAVMKIETAEVRSEKRCFSDQEATSVLYALSG